MVTDIKMCRFDNVPWGFRLVGGSDFEVPLTVVKVTEGSIAEAAGLRVGDVIVRINDTAASPLLHDEAHKIITHCGNVFYFGVCREGEEPENAPKQFPILGREHASTPESFLDVGSSKAYSDDLREREEYLTDLSDRPNSVLSEQSEIKLVEQEIAAVLSGESEMLKEHNVMGILPKPGVCMSSDVLRTLNEESAKTKAEKEKENKKWTTFLQKPNRPIPRSKQQIEAEQRAANAYKVKIVKSAPREASPAVPKVAEPVAEPEPPKIPTPPPAAPVVEEAPPTDSEVPNLEEAAVVNGEQKPADDDTERPNGEDEEKADKEKETSPEIQETDKQPNNASGTATVNNEQAVNSGETASKVSRELTNAQPKQRKTAEELALERQLADVQKQLQALSTLPSTIQATLDAVTKQLGELLPAFKLQQVPPPKVELREINLERIAESKEEEEDGEEKQEREKGGEDNEKVEMEKTSKLEVSRGGDSENDNRDAVEGDAEDVKEEKRHELEEEMDPNLARDLNDYYEETPRDPAKQQQARQHQEETRQMEEEQNLKKQKRHDVIEELEEHLERKSKPKPRSKRAFGPLTPSSERPLVLPGGRRWYRPKDAYNDEFIAETLSAQAELITGSTLGCPYESPLLGYDPNEYFDASVATQLEVNRVNFMKYQKPEKKIDLDRSEVYKIIHHLDRKPVRGIEVRAPVVPAAADIRKAVEL